jgi:uncharacterized protein YggE
VAEYVTLKSALAFVLPTPASSNELHETLRSLTVQLGEPVWTCVPVGAFAGLNVVVGAAHATAEHAMTAANGTVNRKRIRRNTIVSP